MKRFFVSLVGAGVMSLQMTSAFAASIHCDQPISAPVSNNGRVYHFSTTARCTVDEAQAKIEDLKEIYHSYLRSSQSFNVHGLQPSAQYQGMSGYKLSATEQRNTSHGNMSIQSNIYLVDNADDTFIYDAQSTRINAAGNAKYTQSRHQLIKIKEKGPSSYEVKATLEVQVKKPTFAPSGMFKGEVQKGIDKDIVALAKRHASQVAAGR